MRPLASRLGFLSGSIAALALGVSAAAQSHRAPPLESPIVHADRTVTFRLLWLGVGRSDFLYKQAVAFDGFLTEKKIEHVSLVTEGGHTWMNARHYLAETVQRFFKE